LSLGLKYFAEGLANCCAPTICLGVTGGTVYLYVYLYGISLQWLFLNLGFCVFFCLIGTIKLCIAKKSYEEQINRAQEQGEFKVKDSAELDRDEKEIREAAEAKRDGALNVHQKAVLADEEN